MPWSSSSFNERNLLLVAHVGAAILLIGPVTVATSLFPRYAVPDGLPVARMLHRISRAYGIASLAVPALGIVLANRAGSLGLGWVNASFALFAVAFLLLLGVVVPGQRRRLVALEAGAVGAEGRSALRMATGLFALAWLAILFLMVAKPS